MGHRWARPLGLPGCVSLSRALGAPALAWQVSVRTASGIAWTTVPLTEERQVIHDASTRASGWGGASPRQARQGGDRRVTLAARCGGGVTWAGT